MPPREEGEGGRGSVNEVQEDVFAPDVVFISHLQMQSGTRREATAHQGRSSEVHPPRPRAPATPGLEPKDPGSALEVPMA